MLLKYVEDWFRKNEQELKEKNLRIEHIINHEEKKLEAGLTNEINQNAGSFEIVEDGGACDVMIIDYSTNQPLYHNTSYITNTNDLDKLLHGFIKKVIQL